MGRLSSSGVARFVIVETSRRGLWDSNKINNMAGRSLEEYSNNVHDMNPVMFFRVNLLLEFFNYKFSLCYGITTSL